MRDGEDLARRRKEGGVVHRGVVVKGLDNDFVFVSDACVVDIDEAVCRAGQKKRRLRSVE